MIITSVTITKISSRGQIVMPQEMRMEFTKGDN